MDGYHVWLLLLPVAIMFVVAIAMLESRRLAARRAGIERLLDRLGLRFVAGTGPGCSFGLSGGFRMDDDPFGIAEAFEAFEPFGRGYSRTVEWIATGKVGELDWTLLDYAYTTGSGKHRTRWHWTVTICGAPLAFPSMRVREQGFFDTLGEAVGLRDLQFESDEFNQAFHVAADDPRRAYDLLHAEAMEFLLRSGRWPMQFGGSYIVCALRPRVGALELERLMRDVRDFIGLVPGYVREDLGLDGA